MEHYEKIRVVGRGSHGLVTLHRQKQHNKLVIVKEVAVDHLNEDEKKATLNEVRVLSKLKHPNVVAYFDNFVQDASVKIVMEYANKGSLHDLIQVQDGKLIQQDEILQMFTQIVEGLYYIHSQKVLHRDLKTHNIFVSHEPSVYSMPILKIGDFGISKVLTSQSKASTVLGTPSYLSPELCQGQMYDERSDIWALGCILYEMLTLKKAFEAPTLASLVMKIIHGQVTPIDRTKYSAGMEQLLHTLLRISPLDRPTAAMLLSHPLICTTLCKVGTSLGKIIQNT
ncbi:serine/threonine-protein kinase Nek8-like [Frankliniella occidentalis]|uniref:non-specific serine/threonine protein kinase n=1 Tax=Frankliniella occidentalis TaxID=133901 RepID=A0A6J1SWH6_FRAOC|nr:serine/threonine-protein kinase Nek8-like [Frankliniella occidentalis]